MKNYILFIAMCTNLFALNPTEVYQKAYEASSKYTPDSYEVNIKGDIVLQQAKTIASSQINGGKAENVKLVMYFKKGHSPKLIAKNVGDFYSGMYSLFLPHLYLSGFYALVGKNNTQTAFLSKYSLDGAYEEDGKTVIKVSEKGAGGEYALFYLGENNLIEKSLYYASSSLRFTAVITYTNFDAYIMPEKIVYYNEKTGDGRIASSLSFVSYKEIKIEDGFFK